MKIKKNMSKILGVMLSLALLFSMAIVAVPVSAEPGENEWDDIDMPDIQLDTDVGVMAFAPDGSIIYLSVYDEDEEGWSVYKSDDDAFSWDETSLNYDDVSALEDEDETIVDIVVSPDYATDELIYVATTSGNVYRVEEEGEGDVTLLKEIEDNDGDNPAALYDIDLWSDGTDIYILAATDIDVFILQDALFKSWIDQGLGEAAYMAAYAPDFGTSEVIWAIADDGSEDFEVTSTVGAGRWGELWDPADAGDLGSTEVSANVDLAFPDDYDGDAPVLYVALSDDDGAAQGNLYQIAVDEYDSGDETEATALLDDEDGDDDGDAVSSVEVNGAVILVGVYDDNIIYRSDNGGSTFDDAEKLPTGGIDTNIYMVPGDFDDDTGVAYVTTVGAASTSPDESAVSVSRDGGDSYNQISWVDTDLDGGILDMAFSPDDDTALMLTQDDAGAESLWSTADVTDDDSGWERVFSTTVGDVTNPTLVEYSQDGTTVFMYGADEIWKSTDDAHTFGSSLWRSAEGVADWVIVDSATIYAATDEGFLGITSSAPANLDLTTPDFVSIALASDGTTLIIGSDDGVVYASEDNGVTWGDAATFGEDDVDVYVAFDADFAVDGADGEGLAYSASDDKVWVFGFDDDDIVNPDDDDDDVEELSDYDSGEVEVDDVSGLAISADNTLYAMASDAVYRLLLHDFGNVWEQVDQDDMAGQWLTGNTVWTVVDSEELSAFDDTLSGQMTALTVSGEDEDEVTISWTDHDEATEYQIRYTEEDGDDTWDAWDVATEDEDEEEYDIEDLDDDTDYEVRMRVSNGEPLSSRWSEIVSFTTLETIAAPAISVPSMGLQNASTLPHFVWTEVSNAEHYELQISTSPIYTEADGFGTLTLVGSEVSIEEPTVAYTSTETLAYDTAYYVIVRAVSTDSESGDEAISDWAFASFTTQDEDLPAVVIPPQPTPIVTVTIPDFPELPEVPDIGAIVADAVEALVIPDIVLPDIEIPDIVIPDITLPDITLPPVEIPEINLPDISLPEIELPEIILPPVEIPDITLPDIILPEIELPTIEVPPLAMPEVIVNLPTPIVTNVTPTIEAPPTPAYVWAIVAIGAVLSIAVIVLIVRTRRIA